MFFSLFLVRDQDRAEAEGAVAGALAAEVVHGPHRARGQLHRREREAVEALVVAAAHEEVQHACHVDRAQHSGHEAVNKTARSPVSSRLVDTL